MGMKLDFDKITKTVTNFLLQDFLFPYEVRVGNKGLNFRKECPEDCPGRENCYESWCYILDDKNRLKINITQKYNNLPNNILWDIKRGKRKPGEWVWIENSIDVDRFLRQFTGYGFWVQKKNKHY